MLISWRLNLRQHQPNLDWITGLGQQTAPSDHFEPEYWIRPSGPIMTVLMFKHILYLHHGDCWVNLWWERDMYLVLVSVNPKTVTIK